MARPRIEIGQIGTVTLTELDDGTWRARCQYRGQDGKLRTIQRVRKAKTTAERDCRDAALEAATEGDGDITRNSPLSILGESWWQTILTRNKDGQLADSTVANYQRTYDRLMAGIGDLLIRECTATRLGTWTTTESGGYPSVHRDLRRVLSEIFAHGMSIDVVTHNPGAAITPMAAPKKETTALTVEDVLRLRQTVREWEDAQTKPRVKDGKRTGGPVRSGKYLADVVEIMLGTGLRISEVLGLRWQDVDLAAHPVTITVAGSLKTRKAEPGKPSLYWEPRPKSRSSLRTLSIPPFATEVLLRLHVENDAGHQWVFSSGRGTPRFPANVREDLRRACGETFEGLTPHTLRRTVATIVEEGADLRSASMLLGHSGIGVTERAYVRRGRIAPDTSHVLEGVLGDAQPEKRE